MPKTNAAQNNSPNINETRKNPPSKMGATTSNRFCAQVLAKQSPNNACDSSTTFSPLKIWKPAKNDKAIGNDIFWGPKTPIRAPKAHHLKMQVQIPSVQLKSAPRRVDISVTQNICMPVHVPPQRRMGPKFICKNDYDSVQFVPLTSDLFKDD